MSEDLGKQFREEAIQSLQSGQAEQALELINQAIELNEHDSESHVMKGIALAQLNRSEEATTAFRDAIAAGPSNPKAYFNLAVHQYSQGHKVEAQSLATEAVRLDPTHAGAKDLIGRIQRELNPDVITPTGKSPAETNPARPGDPLSGPPAGSVPPGGPPPSGAPPSGMPPSSGAPGGGGPGQPTPPNLGGSPQGNYYRPGYETQNVHSLSFVANMGSGWDTFGFILSAINVIIFVVLIIATVPIMMNAMQHPEAYRNNQPSMFSMTGLSPLMVILSIGSRVIQLVSLIWMILELSDRRGNWLWLLPFIICCCCGLPGAIMPIYIWKGRS